MYYETMLLMLCTGVTSIQQTEPELRPQVSPIKWEKVIALDNNRRTILYNGAYMVMTNLRNNQFKIEHTFNESRYTVKYVGSYDYNTNDFKMQETKFYADGHQEIIYVGAMCKDPLLHN